MKTLTCSILGASALALVILPSAHAQQEPENFIKYRQNYMSAIAGHMGSLGQILRGKVSPAGHAAMHADALAALTADVAKLFPEGSDFGETEAKEEIWSQWDKFMEASAKAGDAAKALAVAVSGGDAQQMQDRFQDLSDGCKGCHKTFRQEKD